MGGYNDVRSIFSSVLEEYGTQKKKMTLVLFEAALEHLCRIHRIIRNPRGRDMYCVYCEWCVWCGVCGVFWGFSLYFYCQFNLNFRIA